MGSFSIEENLKFNYWVTIVYLLKAGIPWEVIEDLRDTDINTVISVLIAFTQQEHDEAERQSRTMK